MAKAKALCTCATCGCTFVREKTCGNRTDADNWEAWAVRNLTECPACYGKRMHQDEIDAGLIVQIRVGITSRAFWLVTFGDTYSQKEDLKARGFEFTDYYPEGHHIANMLGASRTSKRWVKAYPVTLGTAEQVRQTIKADTDAMAAAGWTVDAAVNSIDMAMLGDELKQDAAKNAALDQARGPRPQRPSWMPSGRWNGTVYGKSTKSVYVDGEKIDITAEQAQELDAYLADLKKWKETTV